MQAHVASRGAGLLLYAHLADRIQPRPARQAEDGLLAVVAGSALHRPADSRRASGSVP